MVALICNSPWFLPSPVWSWVHIAHESQAGFRTYTPHKVSIVTSKQKFQQHMHEHTYLIIEMHHVLHVVSVRWTVTVLQKPAGVASLACLFITFYCPFVSTERGQRVAADWGRGGVADSSASLSANHTNAQHPALRHSVCSVWFHYRSFIRGLRNKRRVKITGESRAWTYIPNILTAWQIHPESIRVSIDFQSHWIPIMPKWTLKIECNLPTYGFAWLISHGRVWKGRQHVNVVSLIFVFICVVFKKADKTVIWDCDWTG